MPMTPLPDPVLRWDEDRGPPRSGGSSMLVVRAWWEGADPTGLRARIWRITDGGLEQILTERYATSVDEVEQILADWVRFLREGDRGSGDLWPRD
jgi:hypothetical protein